MIRRPVAARFGAVVVAAAAFGVAACGDDDERGDVQIEESTTGTGTTGTETGGTGTVETETGTQVTQPETSTSP